MSAIVWEGERLFLNVTQCLPTSYIILIQTGFAACLTDIDYRWLSLSLSRAKKKTIFHSCHNYGYRYSNQVKPLYLSDLLFLSNVWVNSSQVKNAKNWKQNSTITTNQHNRGQRESQAVISVTRLGDLLDFGQLFKAFGNNWFAQIAHIFSQISHILRQFL